MNYIEYRRLAPRTFSNVKNNYNLSSYLELKTMVDTLNEMHCVIGITTEVGEYIEAIHKEDQVNKKEELGDMFWYLANLEELRGSKPAKLNPSIISSDNLNLGTISMQLLDIYKKKMFYKSSKYDEVINVWISSFKASLIQACQSNNFDISSILENNINKLKIRYPEKFTTEKADNRDLESERKALENE